MSAIVNALQHGEIFKKITGQTPIEFVESLKK